MAEDDILGTVPPTDSSTEKQGTDDEVPEMVPKAVFLQRLKEVKEGTEKRIKEELRTSGQESKPLDESGRHQEKAKLRELISEIGAEEEAEAKKAKEELDKKIDELRTLDPTLDEKSLLAIKEKYGVEIDGAFKIYNDLKAGQAPIIKPKLPAATKTSDEVKEEIFEPSKVRTLHDAVQEGMKKFGLTK